MSSFDKIKKLYNENFQKFGDSPASLLTPKGRNDLRFRAINPFIIKDSVSILDYGCGLGYLLDYLIKLKLNEKCTYTGYDILPNFIKSCKTKFKNGTFKLISENENFNEKFDIVFASGVFNIKSHHSEFESKEYAFTRIEKLFSITNEVFICDFPSQYVDFKQSDAQHFGVEELLGFCTDKLSRRFILRHDLLPYEMTAIVFKDSSVLRPDNIYLADK
jgi:SAM-dependent methyltransferase